jgi:hypothetical protein
MKILGIKTSELDNLIAETAAYLNILHPDYGKLAARISVTKLHKETNDSFMEVISSLYFYVEDNGKYQLVNDLNKNYRRQSFTYLR